MAVPASTPYAMVFDHAAASTPNRGIKMKLAATLAAAAMPVEIG